MNNNFFCVLGWKYLCQINAEIPWLEKYCHRVATAGYRISKWAEHAQVERKPGIENGLSVSATVFSLLKPTSTLITKECLILNFSRSVRERKISVNSLHWVHCLDMRNQEENCSIQIQLSKYEFLKGWMHRWTGG